MDQVKASVDDGLTSAVAQERRDTDGPNEIATAGGPNPLTILVGQLKGVMTALLIAACVVSALIDEVVDAVAIAVIVVLNVVIGFYQEFQAERAVHALRDMTAPHARVVRDGRVVDVAARDIVKGDILSLDAGDIVAADARLLRAHALLANEAALTGESVPVEKHVDDGGPKATALAERRSDVFMGTAITNGSARAVVTAIGMRTELGKIATLLSNATDEETPLAKRLERVGRTLVMLCAFIVVVIAGIGLAQGRPWMEVLMGAVSLAVAAVPEGLTTIVTVALALGVTRMASRHVLIRHLPSVETLGCATVICTDKTGTLTTGVMETREVWGDDPTRVLFVAAACCDADLDGGTGDPTELAILREAFERQISLRTIEHDLPRVHVNPFDSTRKRMSVRRSDGVLYVKGAFDAIAPLAIGLSPDVANVERDMASRGLRVLAVATGTSDDERDLTVVGLLGLADPPRTEAIAAVAAARRAGIRTIMITGDHAVTANAIAREMGIVRSDDDDEQRVFARATPEDKIALVRRLKEGGAIVAMTGDGVNDAPALKEAHIGIAMGKTGTEVTREAADMILTDDNFATIVDAIREGRGIFDNIRKTLVYLLAGNAGELLLMLGASLAGLPLPLTPLQILWVNLVTDGLPALALVTDPADDDTLRRSPRAPDEPMLGRAQWRSVLIVGLMEASIVGAVFVITLERSDLATARSLAFFTLVLAEVLRAFAARSTSRVLFEVGLFTNVRLLAVVVLTLVLQMGLHFIPAVSTFFDAAPLDFSSENAIVLVAFLPVTILEMSKLIRRAFSASRSAAVTTA